MIGISITSAAFDAIAASLPLGSVSYEPQRTAQDDYFIWIVRSWAKQVGGAATARRCLERNDCPPGCVGGGRASTPPGSRAFTGEGR
jgi:hypothetical protein